MKYPLRVGLAIVAFWALSCGSVFAASLNLLTPTVRPPNAARSWVDVRVDRISSTELLHTDPRQLVDQRRAAAAERLAAIRRPLFFLWAFAQILFLAYLWSSGRAVRMRDALARRIRSRALLRAVYTIVIVALVTAVALPFSEIAYRTTVETGISHEPLLLWFQDFVVSGAIEAIVAAIAVTVTLALVDRFRMWYLYAIAFASLTAFVILYVAPVALLPLFNHATQLDPASPLGKRLLAIEARAGISPRIPIFISDLSKRSEVGNANVAGIGSTKRVIVGDSLLRTATPAEIAFVTAHELGHDHNNDPVKITLANLLYFLAAISCAVLLADRIRPQPGDDEVSRLPLVAACFGLFALIFFPAINAYSRKEEALADQFGLAVSRDGPAGARMFVRFADEGFSPVCPPRIVRLFFYDHPPLGSRIAAVTGRADPCP